MTIKEKARKAGNYLVDRAIESTALVTICNPLYAALEVFYTKMSAEEAISTRIKGMAVTYLGGAAFGSGRKVLNSLWPNNTDSSQNRLSHDALLTGLGAIIITPPFYRYLCDQHDWNKIGIITLAAGILGVAAGIGLGYVADVSRDLIGRGDSNRLPQMIKSQSSTVKKTLAGALVAGSLASLATMYAFSPNKGSVLPIPTTLEAQVISSP